MNRLLIDTHVWLWIISEAPYIKSTVQEALESAAAEQSLYLSPISMWEVALKNSRGRLALDRPVREWLAHAANIPGLQLAPITPAVAAESAELPPEFHGDPADRIIASTARSEGLTLVTHDRALLQLARQGYFKAMAT